jgi:hypothetical protein
LGYSSTCFISIIRIIWLVKTATSVDVPFEYVPIATWTSIETNVTVVIACLMTMKPLLSKFFPNLLGGYQQQSSGGEQPEGRVLTIGSKPSRAPLGSHRQSWNVFQGRHSLLEPGPEEMKDLEGQMAEHGSYPISLPATAHVRQPLHRDHNRLGSRSTLEVEPETNDQSTNSSV